MMGGGVRALSRVSPARRQVGTRARKGKLAI